MPSAGPVCLKCFTCSSVCIVQIYNHYCSIAGPNMDWMAIVIFDPSAGPVCLKCFACSSVYIYSPNLHVQSLVLLARTWIGWLLVSLIQVQGQCGNTKLTTVRAPQKAVLIRSLRTCILFGESIKRNLGEKRGPWASWRLN